MHNYARLKDPALMQNYFNALTRLIGINPSAAYKGFKTVSTDASLTNCQNISHEFMAHNSITSQIELVRSVVINAASVDDVDPNNVFEFINLTGQRNHAFGAPYQLSDLLATFDSLDDFDPTSYGLFYCDNCEELEWEHHAIHAYGEETICRTCKVDDYTYSSYYDEYIYSNDSCEALDEDGDRVTIHEDDDNFHWSDSEDCRVHYNYSDDEDEGEIFGDYHQSKRHQHPIANEWSMSNEGRYFGVELEIESKVDRYEKIKSIHEVLNDGNDVGHRCFFERDGSLSSGFEVITQPMGMEMHESWWKWLQNPQLVSGLRSHNTSTCGLHVHVSRDRILDLQLNKMIAFVNHPDNSKLILSIARRYDTNYAQIKQKTVDNARDGCERYDAVNINTTNQKTVEFRLFKGSLRYEAVMAAIQFVNSLTVFCGQGHFDLSTERFLAFISSKPNNEYLLAYINERMYGIVPSTTTI